MRGNRLDPITPQEAKRIYLDERREDAAYATRRTINDGIDLFLEWAQEEGIENMNIIGGRELRQFKNWCKNTSDNNTVSQNGVMSVIRRFLVFCVDIEAVYPDVPDKTPIPNVPDDEDVCYDKPSDEEVTATREYLETHEPCSRRHVEYKLATELGIRVGAIRAIDIVDVDVDEQWIELRHRPEPEFPDERGTPLKNGKDGGREINISKSLAELIKQYLESPQRPDVNDKFGREPLLTTENGRPGISTIRRDLYKLTRPCEYSNDCPHDRNVDSCDATKNRHASECPSSHSPHPLRRWSIENQIDSGVSKELLSDRVDVSIPVLNEHYDTRSEERKRKTRLEVLEKIFDDYGDPEATVEAGELVEMFVKDDGTIDTSALSDFSRVSEVEDESTPPGVSSPTGQEMTDHPSEKLIDSFDLARDPVQSAIAAGAWVPNRFRREFQELSSGSSNSNGLEVDRIVKGTSAYIIFVFSLAFDLHLLGLIPSGFG